MTHIGCLAVFHAVVTTLALATAGGQEHIKVRVSWGHTSPQATPFHVRLTAKEAKIAELVGHELETGDDLEGTTCDTHAGHGDVDGVVFTLQYAPVQVTPNERIHRFWVDLIGQSDGDTARRLEQDPAYRPDSRVLTVQMDHDGTRGFSVTVDQLLRARVFWVPWLDVYIAAGDAALSFAEHYNQLEPHRGKRILERIRREPEATYEQFTALWEDMGSPAYKHPAQPAPGHIVGLTWDSALYKFGVDLGAGVWNDYGNPDHFRFWFDFGDLLEGIEESWKGQRLLDGLPVITTTIERDGLRYDLEQLAYPLHGPPRGRQGDVPMVLLQKLAVTRTQAGSGPVRLRTHHRREFLSEDGFEIVWRREGDVLLFEESATSRVLFAVEGSDLTVASCMAKHDVSQSEKDKNWREFEVVLAFELAAGASRELVVKLPSPVVGQQDREALVKLDYGGSRRATLEFWAHWVRRGAQFHVPEKVVNDLFRANLWHALRLPRRHGGQEDGVEIDLPYSNFAYDQHGTPWPVNQAVYVDYMLYGLRGYDDVAAEELLTIYRNNQEANGHVKGYANWGVYTPSMIYVVAKNYLLSGDQGAFERLLPCTLKALDWCLSEVRQASVGAAPERGLIRSPLNDLTGEGVWAFTQAYVYAAFDTLGKALQRAGYPRARECFEAAESFRESVERAFGAAAMHSPLVQLRDRTWVPYVPCEATTPGRLLEQWYPTDVDTGAMHLLRLKALPARGILADSLLNDHEDNLYLYGWGMANEPVYNPQATAYLLRDDPEAAIRAFYSYMACAFSHTAFEPVEHRWTWGQYFGPPSTDGAWFELYRNMLIHELDDGSLLLLQAAPRKWLADGQRISVDRAPTYYGDLSLAVASHAASGALTAQIETPKRHSPRRLIVRFRHPQARPIQSVTVNGRSWSHFDAVKEWVIVEGPLDERYTIITRY